MMGELGNYLEALPWVNTRGIVGSALLPEKILSGCRLEDYGRQCWRGEVWRWWEDT